MTQGPQGHQNKRRRRKEGCFGGFVFLFGLVWLVALFCLVFKFSMGGYCRGEGRLWGKQVSKIGNMM